MLAAYSTKDLSKVSFPVVSIYGSEDGVLNLEKYASKKHNLPEDCVELCITGGNHAGFGYYGAQKGDGIATIRAEEQWRTAAELIISVYNNTNNN